MVYGRPKGNHNATQKITTRVDPELWSLLLIESAKLFMSRIEYLDKVLKKALKEDA